MNVKIKGAKAFGVVDAIPSKSYAHRISICNFLSGNAPYSECGNFKSKDIEATENCLQAVLDGKTLLDCGESGSTLRFLLPLMSAVGGEFTFVGHGKLMQRPNEELFKVLNEHGVCTEKTDCIKIKGKLVAGDYHIRGDISSQYVSGLLMALPFLDGDSRIILTTPLNSAPYVDITLEVLKNFNIDILKEKYGFYIKGNQKYCGKVLPEGDWSNSAFFLVLGAICGDVTVKGLNLKSAQGDKYITEILKSSGAEICVEENEIRVKKSSLKGFSFDAESCPDLVPIASVLGAFSKGVSIIKNVERLKIKESDRITTTIDMLASFNVKAEYNGKDLVVYGGRPTNGRADSYNDHRIAMSVAVIATAVDGESELTNAQAVSKSYPTFFEDLRKVGGKFLDV